MSFSLKNIRIHVIFADHLPATTILAGRNVLVLATTFASYVRSLGLKT
jgi:hypothetical protein